MLVHSKMNFDYILFVGELNKIANRNIHTETTLQLKAIISYN